MNGRDTDRVAHCFLLRIEATSGLKGCMHRESCFTDINGAINVL